MDSFITNLKTKANTPKDANNNEEKKDDNVVDADFEEVKEDKKEDKKEENKEKSA